MKCRHHSFTGDPGSSGRSVGPVAAYLLLFSCGCLLLITGSARPGTNQRLTTKAAIDMAEAAVQSISAFDLRITVVQRAHIKGEFKTENNRRVHTRNKKLIAPEITYHSFRQVYSKGKSRIEVLSKEGTSQVSVANGEVSKTWSPSARQCAINRMPLQATFEGMDYLGTYRNLFGTKAVVSILRERKNVTVSENGTLIMLEVPPQPPSSAVALFDRRFQVQLDLEKGCLPVAFEHHQPFAGELRKSSIMTVTGWKQLPNGFYVPTSALLKVFDISPDKGTYGEVAAETELTVDVAHSTWNTEIPASEFELALPRGTTVVDAINQTRFVVGDDNPDKNLRDIADEVKSQLSADSTQSASQSAYGTWVWVTAIAVSMLLVGVLLFYLIRKRRFEYRI